MGASVNVLNLETNMQPAKTIAGVAVPDQAITVSTTAIAMNGTAYDTDTTHIFWTLDGADARVTFDGSAPTTSNGHFIADGASGTWHVDRANAAKWIREAAVDANLHVSEFQR